MLEIDPALEQYIMDHSSPEDKLLAELHRETWVRTVYPQMMAGPLQGKLLEMISRMIRPSRILEIGTFTGYSAICLARGLAGGGKLITIEVDDEITGFARNYIDRSGISDRIELVTGDACNVIPGLSTPFDLIYLDAGKEQYIEYYELALPLLKRGGFMMADNVLWGGRVLEKPDAEDASTKGILAFNRHVADDERVEQIILPIRDGISLIRRL